jgi:hypothetical protein
LRPFKNNIISGIFRSRLQKAALAKKKAALAKKPPRQKFQNNERDVSAPFKQSLPTNKLFKLFGL